MAIPKINEQDIIKALKYIDENGVPSQYKSIKWNLVTEEGKQYPPKYVIAVADYIANGGDFVVNTFGAEDAKNFLVGHGFTVEPKQQEKYKLSVTSERVISTDERFTMDNLSYGDNYKALDVYFKKENGDIIKRSYARAERRISNQTMPRIACQLFEKQIARMSIEEKENFPICKYNPDSEIICGIYSSIDEFKKHRNTLEYMTYGYDNGRQFVIYCWNIFSTIIFVQECLKRFGNPDDEFILTYREKDEKETETNETESIAVRRTTQQFNGYRNPFSSMLIESKNIIFHGAPGTGKSYLAKEIAADIISDGYYDKYSSLTEEQKQQVEFVQFHPSYDYTDFVEGLRPKGNADGTIGFELRDGIFKKFVDCARDNYENSQKSKETIEKEISIQDAIDDFFLDIKFEQEKFETTNGSEFYITNIDDNFIDVYIPKNASVNTRRLNIEKLSSMLNSNRIFEKIRDVTDFFGIKTAQMEFSYYLALYNEILKRKKQKSKTKIKGNELKKYIFIIDEINRGEISKIFGELFFSIDPEYRGKSGEISTQYANLHFNPEKKFYIPDNVYIIGTMNDIDRSVDSFDFAMRRRFRFIELKANEHLEMLADLDDEELEAEAIERMTALNKEIANIEDLNENYQIGASYFLKLKTLSFEQLWEDYLQPLLQEYIRGMYDEEEIMNKFKKAYGYNRFAEGDNNENTPD